MHAVHFGAGNIGRGFIGEVLSKNGFSIDFVDLNETIIDALQARGSYEIELADQDKEQMTVNQVNGINNGQEPEAVVQAISQANIVTTAIGPNILPYIAELICQGLKARQEQGIQEALDVIACENMIGGSQFLKEKVQAFADESLLDYIETYIGFPNAAVDRIVPIQSHEDPLFVSVEPFKEWVIDATQSKNKEIRLDEVLYVEDLEPYIERKLFSVNTGHATVAYTGYYKGYATIDQAMEDSAVKSQLEAVLNETGQLLEAKWHFDADDHQAYIQKIIGRFENPYISDDITRVARTPIRKLGYDERFIRPMREAKQYELSYKHLLKVVAMIFKYDYAEDDQAVALQDKLNKQPLEEVISEVTGLEDKELINQIAKTYQEL
ncbi:mannitol-1-phosphate 5-dehydrogenase [Hutsoniella sourekii]|uniref:mannitol-1-phosphate 5-dehydrogenase n=1 Tax=Hutsoniella sourekii TaxID=87650 RepID=UPI000484088C|nr:mannitol-1-phosphate 5-dehydrogenase [Hutsoniella sourekii]